MFNANLKLPTGTTQARKRAICQMTENSLGLQRASDTRVGNEKKRGVLCIVGAFFFCYFLPHVDRSPWIFLSRCILVGFGLGVSGGERKRLCIAIELIRQPSLILLDEPTSGLSAADALSVVEVLHNLTNSGCTVITSLHQPRSSIFQLFDLLMLMRAGEVVYFGPAKQCVSFFAHMGHPCPPEQSCSDHFLDTISGDIKLTSEIVAGYKATRGFVALQAASVEALCEVGASNPRDEMIRFCFVNEGYALRRHVRIYHLVRRFLLHFVREPSLSWNILVTNAITAVLIGALWSNGAPASSSSS
jgi:hypothetical protein